MTYDKMELRGDGHEKNYLIFLTCLLMFYPSHVFADSGPKPSVKITIHGLQEKAYCDTSFKRSKHWTFWRL